MLPRKRRPFPSSAIDYVIDGDQELRRLQNQLKLAEQTDNGLKQAELHAALDTIGGYTAQARASRLLNGLGLLVPKLQLGNSVWEAPASRHAKPELRLPRSQAGAWEPA